MPKQTTAFELTLQPPERRASYEWLYNALRSEILEGRLGPGNRLPASRELARQYELARGTVVRAFDELKAEGYLEGSTGSGTYVSNVLPEVLFEARKTAAPGRSEKSPNEPSVSEYARRVRPFPSYEPRAPRAFRANIPALDLFPMTLWAQLAARRLRRFSVNALAGCDALGYLPLRQALARYLNASRGVKCAAGQILIVSGAQEALDLAARVLLDRGDRVAIEDPGYVGAARVFESCGAKISPVSVDAEGLRARELYACGLYKSQPRLVYITPGHQFPLGMTMSLSRRLELLEWARASNALIFEDDYDSEYRYSGRPLPALQGIDRHERVLFAGTFSKVLFPALRLGYLVIPPALVDRFAAVKSVSSRHAPVADQAVLADFMEQGHFARHLRRMRQVYSERLTVLMESAREKLAGLLEISPIEAGLQTVGWLTSGIDETAAIREAQARGVEVMGLEHAYRRSKPVRAGLHLGFACVDPKEIRRGVRELAVALAPLTSG
ncbi:MAG TPA: PLP-dependent aminotransferase family protein [Bryobacteraceae bacterium]